MHPAFAAACLLLSMRSPFQNLHDVATPWRSPSNINPLMLRLNLEIGMQTFIIHLLRTERIPFVQSCAAWPLLLSSFGIMALGIAICSIPGLNTAVSMSPVPPSYYIWTVGTTVLYCIAVHIYKLIYIRVFRTWRLSILCSRQMSGSIGNKSSVQAQSH